MKHFKKIIICIICAAILVCSFGSVSYASADTTVSEEILYEPTADMSDLTTLPENMDGQKPIDFNVEQKKLDTGSVKHYLSWANPSEYGDKNLLKYKVQVYAVVYIKYVDSSWLAMSEETRNESNMVWDECALPCVKCCETDALDGKTTIDFTDLKNAVFNDNIEAEPNVLWYLNEPLQATAEILLKMIKSDMPSIADEVFPSRIKYLINNSETGLYIKYSRVKYFARYYRERTSDDGTWAEKDSDGYYHYYFRGRIDSGNNAIKEPKYVNYENYDVEFKSKSLVCFECSSVSLFKDYYYDDEHYAHGYIYPGYNIYLCRYSNGKKYYYYNNNDISESHKDGYRYYRYFPYYNDITQIPGGILNPSYASSDDHNSFPSWTKSIEDNINDDTDFSIKTFYKYIDTNIPIFNGSASNYTDLINDYKSNGKCSYTMYFHNYYGQFVENDTDDMRDAYPDPEPEETETPSPAPTDIDLTPSGLPSPSASPSPSPTVSPTEIPEPTFHPVTPPPDDDHNGDNGNSDVVHWLKKIYNLLFVHFVGDALHGIIDFVKDFISDKADALVSVVNGAADSAQKTFPFSVVFIPKLVFDTLAADPVTPKKQIDISTNETKIANVSIPSIEMKFTLDLKQFNDFAKICRNCMVIVFLMGLVPYTVDVVQMIKDGVGSD